MHATEYTNASRTLLYDIHARDWDDALLGELRIPRAMLPEVRESSGVFGETRARAGSARRSRSRASRATSRRRSSARAASSPGRAKNTYGTGCFLLMNTGGEAPRSKSGLSRRSPGGVGGKVEYALEGSVFVAGAAVQWLRDGLGLVADAAESEAAARSVPDTGGVYLVPAFVGLGAPYWDERARGAIVGLTRGTTRAHLVRAALEAIAYQTRDVVECVRPTPGSRSTSLRVDGGACRERLPDAVPGRRARRRRCARPPMLEVTALGAAALAGLAVGFWRDERELESASSAEARVFEPRLPEARARGALRGLAARRRALARLGAGVSVRRARS